MTHGCQSWFVANLPEWAKAPGSVRCVPLEPAPEGVLATLGSVDLQRRFRRELAIGIRDRSALAVTGEELLVLTRRGSRTRIAARYPRLAAQVVAFQTLPPGGDFLVDRLIIRVGDVAIRAVFDGRLHRDAEGVVAALGGIVPAR
jgi:hypothetical protein